MQPKCPIKRRSVRLLHAIHELHKQGFQNLAGLFYMSPTGLHWRASLKPFSELYVKDDRDIRCTSELSYETANHSSGDTGNLFFGWNDAKHLTARELANLIKQRFPRLLALCKGDNFEYAGWFTYMLGYAEREALPVYFHDYCSPTKEKIFTTDQKTTIISPPHQVLNVKDDIEFIWAKMPDLTNADWHNAYHSIIDAINRCEIQRFPKYPSHTIDTIAHGAYWESAIYYLRTVMNYTSESDYIKDRITRNSRWKEFEIIFDSEGQLHLLDAHMARVAMKEQASKLSSTIKTECENSTSDIELMYRATPYKFPNPYFGGSNPLHLAKLG